MHACVPEEWCGSFDDCADVCRGVHAGQSERALIWLYKEGGFGLAVGGEWVSGWVWVLV